jgi:chromosome segregation ATPase
MAAAKKTRQNALIKPSADSSPVKAAPQKQAASQPAGGRRSSLSRTSPRRKSLGGTESEAQELNHKLNAATGKTQLKEELANANEELAEGKEDLAAQATAADQLQISSAATGQLKGELDTATAQVRNLEKSVKSLETQNKQLQSEVKTKEGQLMRAAEQMIKAQANSTAARKQAEVVQTAADRCEGLEAEIEALKGSSGSGADRCAQLEAEMVCLNAQLGAAHTELEKLKQQQVSKSDEIIRLTEQLRKAS